MYFVKTICQIRLDNQVVWLMKINTVTIEGLHKNSQVHDLFIQNKSDLTYPLKTCRIKHCLSCDVNVLSQ